MKPLAYHLACRADAKKIKQVLSLDNNNCSTIVSLSEVQCCTVNKLLQADKSLID